jgi:hypothetical protein
MYNGNGSKFGNGLPRRNFGIRPLYLYIGIGILVLIALWFVSNLIGGLVQSWYALVAGVLLVLGNLRDVILNPYPQRSNTALLNTMIGAALILFFVGSAFGALWYIPAVLLLLIAAPLMLGRADVYAAYMMTARNAADGVRRVISNVPRP